MEQALALPWGDRWLFDEGEEQQSKGSMGPPKILLPIFEGAYKESAPARDPWQIPKFSN
jgi:hypothetical protein